MPTTSGGTYHSLHMKRLDGKGIRQDVLKKTEVLKDKILGGFININEIPKMNIKNTKGLEKLTKLADLSIIPKKKSLINFNI